MQPTETQIAGFLAGLRKGDHLALLWAAPEGINPSLCCICYLRVSSGRQLDGKGLPDQWEACVAYAQRMGWTIIGLYVDPAISGRKESRPAIDKLKRDARSRRFQFALFYRVNRMGRNAPAMFTVAEDVERSGVEVVSATEHFNRQSAAGKLAFGMFTIFAQFGSDQLGEVMKHTLASKARRGEWIGPVPLGYTKNTETQSLDENAMSPVLQRIFRLYATGNESYTSIADHLNSEGHRTQEGRPFGRESVRTILRNRAYLGIVTCDDKEYPGNHTALIDQATWVACERVRKQRESGNHGQHTVGGGGLLSEIAYCERCGKRLWYQPQRKNGKIVAIYYYCSGRSHRTCTALMMRAEVIEQQVIDLLRAVILPKDSIERVITLAQQQLIHEEQVPAVRPDVIKEQLRRLGVSYRLGDLDDDVYLKERARLQELLEQTPVPRPLVDLRQVASRLQSLGQWIDCGDATQQRAVIHSVVHGVWASKEKGLVQWSSTILYQPFIEAAQILNGGWLTGIKHVPYSVL